MIGTIIAVGVLVALLAWFFWPAAEARQDIDPGRRPGVDLAELEQAEREVQEAADQDSVRDWGPGIQKPPL